MKTLLNRIFGSKHTCNMKTVDTMSNEKGVIWFQECSCGRKREVLFDANDNCVNVKKFKK